MVRLQAWFVSKGTVCSEAGKLVWESMWGLKFFFWSSWVAARVGSTVHYNSAVETKKPNLIIECMYITRKKEV